EEDVPSQRHCQNSRQGPFPAAALRLLIVLRSVKHVVHDLPFLEAVLPSGLRTESKHVACQDLAARNSLICRVLRAAGGGRRAGDSYGSDKSYWTNLQILKGFDGFEAFFKDSSKGGVLFQFQQLGDADLEFFPKPAGGQRRERLPGRLARGFVKDRQEKIG